MFFIVLVACNSENAPDCIRSEGAIIQTEINVSSFSRILVYNNIQLFILKVQNKK